jgi:hypothetical protein
MPQAVPSAASAGGEGDCVTASGELIRRPSDRGGREPRRRFPVQRATDRGSPGSFSARCHLRCQPVTLPRLRSMIPSRTACSGTRTRTARQFLTVECPPAVALRSDPRGPGHPGLMTLPRPDPMWSGGRRKVASVEGAAMSALLTTLRRLVQTPAARGYRVGIELAW